MRVLTGQGLMAAQGALIGASGFLPVGWLADSCFESKVLVLFTCVRVVQTSPGLPAVGASGGVEGFPSELQLSTSLARNWLPHDQHPVCHTLLPCG